MKKLLATKPGRLLLYTVAVIVGLYLIFTTFYKAQSFFAPLTMALVLSLIILPLTQRFESVMSRTWSSLLSVFVMLIASLMLVGLIVIQLNNFTARWPTIKENMTPKIERMQAYIVEKTPVSKYHFKDMREQITRSTSGFSLQNTGKRVSNLIMQIVGFFGLYVLTFIYIFFMLRYREMFKKFLLIITEESRQSNVQKILTNASSVATNYLRGKLILIGLLSIIYSIGLGFSGVSDFILVSIIAAVLTLIPYIGNIFGFAIALAFGYLTTANSMTLIGITLTFTISQFVESYLLEPYIVGDKVKVHPFFIIVSVIFGNFMWGIIGMVLAIPLMAIITVTLKSIPELRPIGLLLSTEKFSDNAKA